MAGQGPFAAKPSSQVSGASIIPLPQNGGGDGGGDGGGVGDGGCDGGGLTKIVTESVAVVDPVQVRV